MYNYEWDAETGGYLITSRTDRFVANELRPVFAEEMSLTGLDSRLDYDRNEIRPFMWAQKNQYFYKGEKIAQANSVRYGKPFDVSYYFDGVKKLEPVDVEKMIAKNQLIMSALIDDTKKRTKELYDADIKKCDKVYIAFSGGKDSIALLNICEEVLPVDVPVIFSDTDMELPDTYRIWDIVKRKYSKRKFICAKAESRAVDNWEVFGPPSRTIRWCCSIHKSTPALIYLKKLLNKPAIRVMAFVGVRGEESISRSFYEDSNDGIKSASQMNRMPILDWGSHELWLYIFKHQLPINNAYRLGLPRVGCIMCPESSEKYVWLVDKAYPGAIKPYVKTILKTSVKTFSDDEERNDFIAKQGWQARKSGITLNETITAPIESTEGLSTIFKSSLLNEKLFYTWLKPIGTVVKDMETSEYLLKLPKSLGSGIPFDFHRKLSGGAIVRFNFHSEDERLHLVPIIRTLMSKSSACIGCRACEAECTHGALYFENGEVEIDEDKCVHCQQCFNNIDYGCWRYKSMYKSENGQKKQINSINRYNNFGLREKDMNLWVSTLVEMGEDFFPWNNDHPLGKKMVEAASAWFQQAELITNKGRKPSALAEYFGLVGGDDSLGWELIWMGLANNAVLIKWFISNTKIGEAVSVEKLADMLKVDYPQLGASTIKGGLAALKDMVTKSPIGDEGAFVSYEIKGKSVLSLTRNAKEIHPLTILYGLYLCARLADCATFTVTGLMDADIDSLYISPIVAFGLSGGNFKRICEGLHSRYPDYIATTFTHGNDEIRVFPEKFKPEDIVKLAIQEA